MAIYSSDDLAYVDANTFRVTDGVDHTSDEGGFDEGRALRMDCGETDGVKYGHVLSASYSDPDTTVNLRPDSDAITGNLEEVITSPAKPGDEGNLPVHDHESDGDGGQIDTDAINTKTGADANVVTGTAGDDGDLVIWNADGDAVEGPALGNDVAGGFDSLAARLNALGLSVVTEQISYDGSDFLHHWVYIPPFTVTGISGVTFGGFYVGQFGSSQPNATPTDDNPDVADDGDATDVPAISQRGVSPWRYIDSLDARKAAAALGTGCHLITAFEWSSLAYWGLEHGYLPRGNNANSDPPADQFGEEGLLDEACHTRNGDWHCALTGSGPTTWALGGGTSGVWDLNGNMWEWTDGLLLLPASLSDDSTTPHTITGAGGAGYCLILANFEVSLAKAPYGASTATAAGSLTDSNKAWTADEFIGCWLYDAAGDLFYIDDNDATSVTIDGSDTPTSGPYTILKLEETDITSGMSSGNRILTLQSDADLEPLAIPATSDATGSGTYGNDGYWFDDTALRAALRGGYWSGGVRAGVFALTLNGAPGYSLNSIGLRVSKAL